MEEILSWLKEKNPGFSGEIPADVDLIETRMIESLNFLEFISLLEEISGKIIDIGSLSVDDFRTLDRIATTFLDDGPLSLMISLGDAELPGERSQARA